MPIFSRAMKIRFFLCSIVYCVYALRSTWLKNETWFRYFFFLNFSFELDISTGVIQTENKLTVLSRGHMRSINIHVYGVIKQLIVKISFAARSPSATLYLLWMQSVWPPNFSRPRWHEKKCNVVLLLIAFELYGLEQVMEVNICLTNLILNNCLTDWLFYSVSHEIEVDSSFLGT